MSDHADNVRRFKADIAKWRPRLQQRMDTLVQRVATRVIENVVVGGAYGPGTPVRTGFARASWWVSVGDTARVAAAPVKGQHEYESGLTAALTVLGGVTAKGGTIYALNDAAYIRALEFGHSQQAPSGMVRVVVAQIQTIVDTEARALLGGSGQEPA